MAPPPSTQHAIQAPSYYSRWPGPWKIVAPCLIGLSLIVVIHRAHRPSGIAEMDDGWRRTASGWENRNTWKARFVGGFLPNLRIGMPNANRVRFDTHPAALALAQIVGVLFGLYAFPADRRGEGHSIWNTWRSVLARSFRASPFGT